MSRAFLVPVGLPADPVQPMELATKQYVDGFRSDEVWVGPDDPYIADPTGSWELWITPPTLSATLVAAAPDVMFLSIGDADTPPNTGFTTLGGLTAGGSYTARPSHELALTSPATQIADAGGEATWTYDGSPPPIRIGGGDVPVFGTATLTISEDATGAEYVHVLEARYALFDLTHWSAYGGGKGWVEVGFAVPGEPCRLEISGPSGTLTPPELDQVAGVYGLRWDAVGCTPGTVSLRVWAEEASGYPQLLAEQAAVVPPPDGLTIDTEPLVRGVPAIATTTGLDPGLAYSLNDQTEWRQAITVTPLTGDVCPADGIMRWQVTAQGANGAWPGSGPYTAYVMWGSGLMNTYQSFAGTVAL